MDPLNGINAGHDTGEDGRLISRSRADLQDPVIAGGLQCLGHFRHDIGLGDGLLLTDGKGEIAVGLVHQGLADKQVPGHRAHGAQHKGIGDAAPRDLVFHHLFAPAYISYFFVFHNHAV